MIGGHYLSDQSVTHYKPACDALQNQPVTHYKSSWQTHSQNALPMILWRCIKIAFFIITPLTRKILITFLHLTIDTDDNDNQQGITDSQLLLRMYSICLNSLIDYINHS